MAISSIPRVALLSTGVGPDGPIVGLARGLKARGLAPLLVTPEGGLADKFRAEGFEVEQLPAAIPFLPGQGWRGRRLAGLLRRREIQIIHALDDEASGLAASGPVNQAFAAMATSGLSPKPKTYASLRRMSRVLVPSKEYVRLCMENGVEEDRLRVVPFGFDPEDLRPTTDSRDKLRERYRTEFCPDTRNPLFLLNVSPIRRDSGHGVILEALIKVVTRLPQTFWICFGKSGADPEAEERLARRAKELALDRHVAILGFAQGDDDANPRLDGPDLTRASDLYVHVGQPGGSVHGVAGAVASGLPVVATETPEIDAYVRDGQNGRLVSDTGPEPLALAILEVLENRRQREHYARLCESMAKHFAPDAVAGAILDVYRELI